MHHLAANCPAPRIRRKPAVNSLPARRRQRDNHNVFMVKFFHRCSPRALLLAILLVSPAQAMEQIHREILLLAYDAEPQAHGIQRTPPETALKRLARAYDMLVNQSPASAKAIRDMRVQGTVILIYYPGALRSRRSLNAETVALYLPDFLKKRGKSLGKGPEFIVVVNHIGIRWKPHELAGLIAHELVGHGGQHRRGWLADSRPIDLECEASLHEEQAYQDLRIPKTDRGMIAFRKRLETHHCSDFRTYLRRKRPRSMFLWAVRNPNIPALLREFNAYRQATAGLKANQISRRTR